MILSDDALCLSPSKDGRDAQKSFIGSQWQLLWEITHGTRESRSAEHKSVAAMQRHNPL
jgi:hypothetical protein